MPTVDALRNEIRVAVGRYEREISSGFTKEALAAICEAVGDPVGERLPSKPEMRARILTAVEGETYDPTELERSFRKGELDTIAETLRES
jgi:hypothetical protein